MEKISYNEIESEIKIKGLLSGPLNPYVNSPYVSFTVHAVIQYCG